MNLETLDGDFALDAPVVQHLLQQGPSGPEMRATPPASGRGATQPAGRSRVLNYLFPETEPDAPASSIARLNQEAPGAIYGAGNVLGNSSAALAGALQGVNEAGTLRRMQAGLAAINAGGAQRVRLSPHMELYNAAERGQRPRVRLRIRGLPIQVINRAIPGTGGPATQWRANGSGTSATLRGSSMSAQQMRNAAVMAGEQRLPAWLRWTQGRTGSGVLAFAPTAALDLVGSIDVDQASGQRSFNGRRFLVQSAGSQSGNLAGFAGGWGAVWAVGFVTAGAVAGAPLVIIGLVAGVAVQVAFNTAGYGDAIEGAAERALN